MERGVAEGNERPSHYSRSRPKEELGRLGVLNRIMPSKARKRTNTKQQEDIFRGDQNSRVRPTHHFSLGTTVKVKRRPCGRSEQGKNKEIWKEGVRVPFKGLSVICRRCSTLKKKKEGEEKLRSKANEGRRENEVDLLTTFDLPLSWAKIHYHQGQGRKIHSPIPKLAN